MNFQMFKLVLEKAEEPEIKLATSAGSSKKQESSRKTSISFQKNIYFCFIDYAKAFNCVDHNKLWKILKDDAVKVLHSICQQILKTHQWSRDRKRSAFIPIPKKGNAKECSHYYTIALMSHTSKVMLKILQARIQQYVNCERPNFQAGLRKGRGTRDQIGNICWIIKKAREFQKNIYF